MNVVVCVKRVPSVGAKITLMEDEQAIDTRHLGFAISPHEECAVEEAVAIVKEHGGHSIVLTLGPAAALEQLRYALAMGIDEAILLQIGRDDWEPMATARAIAATLEEREIDLLLFGNESADSSGYQVGARVAHALGMPLVTGIKAIDIKDGVVTAKRETPNGWDVFEVPLPAVLTVKEGINLPSYASVPGRLRAKRKPFSDSKPRKKSGGLAQIRFRVPEAVEKEVDILGEGPSAAVKIVDLMEKLEVLT